VTFLTSILPLILHASPLDTWRYNGGGEDGLMPEKMERMPRDLRDSAMACLADNASECSLQGHFTAYPQTQKGTRHT